MCHFHFLKKVVAATLASAIVTSAISFPAEAGLAKPYRFTATLSNIRIHYLDAYANTYGISTMRSAFAWIQDTRLKFMHFYRTTTASSDVYCYMYSNSSSGSLAYTTYYYNSSQVNSNSTNWDCCKIYLNHAKTVSIGTITHEFGHVLGLNDNNSNPKSIMCQVAYGRTATSPSYADCTLVYQKYSPYVG